MKDTMGNEYDEVITTAPGKIIVTRTYSLPKDKTTLKGEYVKLTCSSCCFPERQSCNYGPGFERCKYMSFAGCSWHCTFNVSVSTREVDKKGVCDGPK